jgi:hypothetical protein
MAHCSEVKVLGSMSSDKLSVILVFLYFYSYSHKFCDIQLALSRLCNSPTDSGELNDQEPCVL